METSPAGLISVSVPSRAEYVHVLRAVTASVAARIPVSFDGIEDLRLAVDEACAQVLAIRSGSTTLTLTLRPLPDRLEAVITVDAVAEDDWPPPGIEETLGWRVLSALVDTVTLAGAPAPSIHLSKRALEPSASSS